MINVQEQATGMSCRAGNVRYQFQDMGNIAGSTSYVTGAHAFKTGFNWKLGTLHFIDYDLQPVSYRFRNAIPTGSHSAPWASGRPPSMPIWGSSCRIAGRSAT